MKFLNCFLHRENVSRIFDTIFHFSGWWWRPGQCPIFQIDIFLISQLRCFNERLLLSSFRTFLRLFKDNARFVGKLLFDVEHSISSFYGASPWAAIYRPKIQNFEFGGWRVRAAILPFFPP